MMVEVANYLSKEHEVDFLTFRKSEVMQPLSTRVRHIHNPLYGSKNKLFELIMQIIKLHAVLKNEKYDVAIAFLVPSSYMLTLAAIGTRTRVLLSERADPITRRKNGGFFIRLRDWINYTADMFVFQSEGAKAAYPQKCQRRGVVIPNAVKSPGWTAPLNDTKKIVHVARMELVQKRQDVMLEAFRLFLKTHTDYILYFYGDGPDEDKVREMADSAGVSENVRFMGAQKDILKQISDAEMFVLTSDYEGIPNALLEAMSIGLPCITTDCSPGGARMVVDNNINGFITPCGDSSAIAEKMCVMAENPGIRKMFSENAAEKINVFAPEKIHEKWDMIFKKPMRKE